MCGPCHLTAFCACLVHFRTKRGTIRGNLSNRDNQLPIEGHKCIELLDNLMEERKTKVNKLRKYRAHKSILTLKMYEADK